MVVAPEPDLIILDEPTAGMSAEETARAADLIRELNRSHAIVVVEHDMQFIRAIARTVTVFHQGRVLIEDAAEPCWPTRGCATSISGARSRHDRRSRDLFAGYGRIGVLDGVSFAVAAGECVGILGHNGMGKSTLLRTIVGLLPAWRGRILLDGKPLGASAREPARPRRDSATCRKGARSFRACPRARTCISARSRKAATPPRSEARCWPTSPSCSACSTAPAAPCPAASSSCWPWRAPSAGAPRLLLLDEPTEGIQPSIVQAICDRIGDLRRRRGLTVLLVEQNLEFIRALADRVLLIHRGRILRELDREAIADPALEQEFVSGGADPQ